MSSQQTPQKESKKMSPRLRTWAMAVILIIVFFAGVFARPGLETASNFLRHQTSLALLSLGKAIDHPVNYDLGNPANTYTGELLEKREGK